MTIVLVIGIVGILIAVLVVTPLVSRAARAESAAAARATRQEGRRSRADVGAAPSRSRLPPPPASGGGAFIGPEEDEATLDSAGIEGRVKASSMKKVGTIVSHHPDEALAVVRSWMNRDQ
jgi:flagellar M-ring protein FliF